MKLKRKTIALLLALVFAVMSLGGALAEAGPVFENGRDAADSDFDGIPDQYDVAPNSNTFTGKMKSGHDGTTTVSFTMDFRNFFGGNTVYHPELATVSVLGSALAYYKENYGDAYFTFDTAQVYAGGTASKVDGL